MKYADAWEELKEELSNMYTKLDAAYREIDYYNADLRQVVKAERRQVQVIRDLIEELEEEFE